MKKPFKEEPFLLTFTDLLRVLKKKKYKIYAGILACALLALYYGLTKPIEYQAEGTFKEKGKSSAGLTQSVTAAFLLGGDGQDSDALMMMKSRHLVEQLVKQLGLQGILSKDEGKPSFLPWKDVQQNLLVEYALFTKAKKPILDDFHDELNVSEISYQGEYPISVRLFFNTEDSFDVIDSNDQVIGSGKLGEPFVSKTFTALINRSTEDPLTARAYGLTLLPLGATAESLSKQFVVENDRFDKSLIKISCKHRNRHKAVAYVNALMNVYQEHIHNEHRRLCCLQVDYLVQRQKEMAQQLETMMRNYANDQSYGLSSTGFASSDNAINFLANNQQGYKQKLMAIDLEVQQIEHAQKQGKISYDKLMLLQNAEALNNLTTEIRALKQQADSLDLALHDHAIDRQNFQQSFIDQIAELEEVKICAEEAKSVLADLQQDRLQTPPQHLLDNPKFMVKAWYDRLVETKTNPDTSDTAWNNCKKSMASYMTHLIHYLNVHQRSVEERLAHQQLPVNDFQGINPTTAEELYISYSKELNELESKTAQQRFITQHINEPDFEISSLSTLLNDPVSAEMISGASNIVLALRDMDNRSGREQDRLRAELAIQKGFLTTHLKQAVQLSELHQNLIKENIKDLQSATLSLIQERVSILENHITEFIAERLESLKQEKIFIEQNLADLRTEMASFPQKWVAEQLIHHQMEINQNMVEEISKLVESKNIANNLEKIQSAPVDTPLTPIHPKSPRLLLLTIVGAIGGSFLSIASVLIASVARGVEASQENLQLAGQHVSGRISREYRLGLSKEPMLDSDLDTLRRLIAFAADETSGIQKHALLLLMGTGPNYAANLAELMAKKGRKILLMDLCFDSCQTPDTCHQNPGMLQYLDGSAPKPQIVKGASYDSVSAGGFCRYSSELLSSKKFSELCDEYLKTYDWVVGCTKACVKSAEAETLLKFFPSAAISIAGETLPQLKAAMEYAPDEKKISFIITS